tara:strand:- start:219 stop:461 length:243 start_codon:yes stop_codon:yes gene_type:complete
MDYEILMDLITKVGIPSAGLIYLLYWATKSLSDQIDDLRQIIVKLIDRTNLKDKEDQDHRDKVKEALADVEKEVARHWKA